MKVLIDMNLSPRWASVLREAGIECEHWSKVGAFDAPDSALFAYASQGKWTILTHDLDFGAILVASRGLGPSVVQMRTDDLRPEMVGDFVVSTLRQIESELEAGALATLEPQRRRVRILPLADFSR